MYNYCYYTWLRALYCTNNAIFLREERVKIKKTHYELPDNKG